MEPEAKPRVPFSLEGVQNPWTPVTTCNNCFLYLCIIVIPLLEVLLSSSNIITADYSLFNKHTNEKQLPRTRGCFVHSTKLTNAGNNQGDVHPVYITFHVTRRVASHVTCVCVARHMIGSRPIKLHNLHRGITILCISGLTQSAV